jgi:hypothetical protein
MKIVFILGLDGARILDEGSDDRHLLEEELSKLSETLDRALSENKRAE